MATARGITPGEDWGSVLAYMDRGTILVLGDRGTGKTTLARWLLGQLDRGLERVALVDCDPDRSHIGVPGCIGLAMTGPWQAPAAQWFVGSLGSGGNRSPETNGTAPATDLSTLHTVTGVVRLARRARQRGAQAVLLDTTGLIDGPRARSLKVQLAQATGADQVVALERQHELSPLLALLAADGREIRRIGVSKVARRASDEDRLEHRRDRFAAHFRTARSRFLSPRRLFRDDWTPARNSDLVPGRVLGHLDGQGYCLGLGLVRQVHADRVEVLTPVADVPVVRSRLADFRLDPAELGLDLELGLEAEPEPGLPTEPVPPEPDAVAELDAALQD